MFDRQRFINDLRELSTMDVPWLHQGKDPAVGMDCVHVLRWAYERQQPLPEDLAREFEHYHERPDGVRLLRIMRQWFQEVPESEAQPGDLLLFFARKNPQHLAALIGENEVAEAYRSDDGYVKRFLCQPLDPRRRIAAVFRIPDFA